MSHNEPEHKAGFTDAEYERYGDAVLMTWRDWANLREEIQQHLRETNQGLHGNGALSPKDGYGMGLEWVMQTMDETLP